MTTISANLQANLFTVRRRVADACAAAGREAADVALLAVSKTWPGQAIAALAACGQRRFGESYVHEALAKIDGLRQLDLEWHFIGPLQSNKTRSVAENFAWVHGVDRLKIAERLAVQRPAALPPLNICVEVNVSGEESKSGSVPSETAALCRAVAALPRLRLRGLMAIPEPTDDSLLQRRRFAQVRELRNRLNAEGLGLDTLSMGMSQDLETAIMEGATIVRVGTAIFGERL